MLLNFLTLTEGVIIMYKNIVFIDFDGTITSEETLVGVMKKLVSKESFDKRFAEAKKAEKTISQMLKEFFSEIPSNRISEVMAYIETIPLRAGFEDFLDYLKEVQVPVVVISGGLSPMVNYKMQRYRGKLLDVHSVELNLTGQFMRLESSFDDGIELLKKTDIMRQYDYEKSICIGDSYTDMNMAMASDFILARDELADYLTKKGKVYEKWEDFYDVLKIVKEILNTYKV
jgi:2-hydroxy-3-keto-5-methylthiopentenyl-1-phosphate phosphatase